MTELNTSNINRIWADLVVEELVRAGAGIFCIAPGSRSTPLATAVSANPRAEHIIHFDERGTAFFALGYARATCRPAVWLTTSGTAVANGFPAVVEAALDGVPLILLTADRPPELRDAGANQTIDQIKIFGDYVRWQFDLPAPDTAIDPAMVLTIIDQAVYRSRRMPAGPVHLNCMFREPLAPDDDGCVYDRYLAPLAAWKAHSRPYTRYAPTRPTLGEGEAGRIWASLRNARRGLLVAGRMDSPAQADAVRWLGERLGWPVLPDVGSHLRLGGPAAPSGVVPYYDLMLVSVEFRARSVPDAVLHVGGRITSKRLMQFLANSSPDPYIVARENSSRLDPHHCVTQTVEADIVSFCEDLVDVIDRDADSDSEWMEAWVSAAGTAARELVRMGLDAGLEGGAGASPTEPGALVTEPGASRAISRLIPENSGLFLAGSMPIRDMDMFGSEDGAGPIIGANRGASGIDGTIASAAGFGRGLRGPVTLLIGDLALLHDLNSLALLKNSPFPLVIIAVNNHGGGIFSFLPISRHRDVFETYFGTPHELTFEHAAAMFGLDYTRASTMDELIRSYRAALGSTKSAIIELSTDRGENLQLHRRLEEAVSRAIN